MEDTKSFYNVIKMSEAFRKWDDATKTIETINDQFQFDLQLWEVRAQLAIAQQLTMIAQRLGAIVEKSKRE